MVLIVSHHQYQSLQKHGEQTYPEECCGLLLGTQTAVSEAKEVESQKTVQMVYPTLNVWESKTAVAPESPATSVRNRYQIAPEALFQAQRYARTNGWDIIGIYHSHPDQPAVPSEWDRAWAWPQYSYAIVAVENGTACDLQSWTLDTCHEFLPERLMVSG